MNIQELLKVMIDTGASDIHLKTGRPALLRIKGDLGPMEMEPLDAATMSDLCQQILTEKQREGFDFKNEFDCAYNWEGVARFRANIFRQRGLLSCVMRVIPAVIPELDDLDVPKSYYKVSEVAERGLVLITGATGSGKSTTLAAMINEINKSSHEHIVTIEDPIEFVHPDKNCSICQREVGLDTETFASALRYVLRQDPDVILIGEMRDAETVRAAISAAETGHMVFSTLHTMDATQTIDRIVDFFPSDQQNQIRVQLANSLKAVISQRLVKSADGQGRVCAAEVMFCTPTIRAYIQENKLSSIRTLIKDGSNDQMMTFDQCLVDLLKKNKITKAEALANATSPSEVELAMKGITSSKGSAQNILSSMHAQQNKQDIATAMNQGINFMKRELMEEAGAAFKKVLRMDPNHREAKHYLETLEQSVGNQMMTEEAKIYIKNGLEFYQVDKIAEAVAEWEQALGIDPNNAQAKAYIKGAQDRVQSLQLARAHIDRGVQAYQSGDLTNAMLAWKEALKNDPHNDQAAHYLAEGKKQEEKIERDAEAKALFLAAANDYQAGNPLAAAAHWAAALKINPEYQEAREYFEEAKKMVEQKGLEGFDPAAPDASAILEPYHEGIIAIYENRYRDAATAFNKAKGKRPTFQPLNDLLETARLLRNEESDSANKRARAKYDKGDLVSAMEIWTIAAENHSKHEGIAAALAEVRPIVLQKAQDWYQESVDLMREGHPAAAVEKLKSVVKIDPTNQNAQKRLQEASESAQKLGSILANT